MFLTPNAERIVGALLRKDVSKTLRGLQGFTNASLWVGKRNRYLDDTVEKLKIEIGNGRIERPKQLSQYIAASVVLHSADGWSYLGRSLTALLRGDPHRSRHLAYYAELRAAMSLLASVGIGVFNTKHFAIDAPDSVKLLPGSYRTHPFVWECLQYWSGLSTSGDLFAKTIVPGERSLEDWFFPVGGTASLAAQAKAWFSDWGMDLKYPIEDHFARNESSYRPDGLHRPWIIDAARALQFTREFWSAVEPSGTSRFEQIDSHLLRLTVEAAFKGQTGLEPIRDRQQFRIYVQKIIDYQAFSKPIAKLWTRFLLRNHVPKDLSILRHSRIAPEKWEQSHLSVFSRAALLLRLASGSALELLQTSGIQSTSFWWASIGNSRGMWDGDLSASVLDLWADVEPNLQDIDNFMSTHESGDRTFYRIEKELGAALSNLGCCERIAIWGMVP